MELMPEISGKLETALAAVVSPKTSPVFLSDDEALEQGAHDERTSPQKRHDAFASLIDAAARSAEVASMGGAAPTVLVWVDASALIAGRELSASLLAEEAGMTLEVVPSAEEITFVARLAG